MQSHPEFQLLLDRWLTGNRTNNAGDLVRFYALLLNLKQVDREGVSGDFAELGVYRGNSAAVLAHFAAQSGRRLFLFDTFQGFDVRDITGVDSTRQIQFADGSLERVKDTVGYTSSCVYVQGYFPASVTREASDSTFAFVHLDCDLYKPMKDGLAFFYPRLAKGGAIFMHDYSSGQWEGARQAVDEFCADTGERIVLLPDKSGTAVIRKSQLSGATK